MVKNYYYIILILICFGYSLYGMNSDQRNKQPLPRSSSISLLQTIANFLGTSSLIFGSFVFDVITFNPKAAKIEHCRKKKRIVSDSLTIVTRPHITVKNDPYHLIIDGTYYDSTLKGTLRYNDLGQMNCSAASCGVSK